jgi:hypothetical protein
MTGWRAISKTFNCALPVLETLSMVVWQPRGWPHLIDSDYSSQLTKKYRNAPGVAVS